VQINGQPFDTISLSGATDITWSAVSWQPTVSGTYTITAVMTDSLNNTLSDSIQVFIEVDGVFVMGDTTCDTTRNVVDALYIMQYEVGLRTADNDCPLEPDTLFLPACDVNGDMACNVVDALFIMQCEVGISNSLCPTVIPTEAQVEELMGEGASATAETQSGIRPFNRRTTIQIENGLVGVGETTTLPVWVNVPADNGLMAVTLDVTFDPTIVAFDGCTINDSVFDLSLCALQDDGRTVSITALAVSGFSGETFLAEISFTGLAQGSSALDLASRTFEDGSGQEPRLRDGRLRVRNGGGNLESEKEIMVSNKVLRAATGTVEGSEGGAAVPEPVVPELVVPATITIGSGVTASGDPLTVPITLDVPPGNNLTAVTLRIQYDPNVLMFDSCVVNNVDFDFNLCNRSEGDGVPPDIVSFSAISIFGVNGTLELGTITFVGSNVGSSSLVLVAETFEDGSGEAPIIVNGTIDVEEPTAVNMDQMSAAVISEENISTVLLIFILVLASVVVIFLMRKTDRKFN
jgi:hypothetical protein